MGLYRLQEKLNHTHQLADMDVCEVIGPFCQIVQSDDTTGPVTGMAISSLDKLLAYNLIGGWGRWAGRYCCCVHSDCYVLYYICSTKSSEELYTYMYIPCICRHNFCVTRSFDAELNSKIQK